MISSTTRATDTAIQDVKIAGRRHAVQAQPRGGHAPALGARELHAADAVDLLRRGGTEEREAERAELGLLELVAAAEDDDEGPAVAHVHEGLELPVRRHGIRRGLKRGLATLCVGGGMGIATIVERV